MIDPSKYQSFQPITEVAASKLEKVALNPQPLPPKIAGFADGAVVSPRSDAASLNPQPLPPKAAGLGTAAVNPAIATFGISIEGLPQQLGNLVGDVLSKVALNPQPLPPKTVGSIFADVLSKVGIIIVSGKGREVREDPEPEPEHPQPLPAAFDGKAIATQAANANRFEQAGIIIVSGKGGNVSEDPEPEPMPSRRVFDGKAIATQAAHANRFEQAGIIIVSGKGGKVSEEDPDDGDPQARRPAFALQSIAAEALHSIIEQAIERAAKGERGAKASR